MEESGDVRRSETQTERRFLHVAEQGPAAVRAVLLLHGFPELWLYWCHQMAALAAPSSPTSSLG